MKEPRRTTVWQASPQSPRLDGDEVHVWRVSLIVPESRLIALQRILSEDERHRAESFYFQRDRQRFTVARGALRTILAGYLNAPPEGLCFRYSPRGKPDLWDESGEGDLRFNLAHSGELALVAVTRRRAVGVDLERIRLDVECGSIARRFFSPAEAQALFALPLAARVNAFYRGWTRKEACLKAWGHGLSLPLDQFDVSVAPGEPAALLVTRPNPNEAARWSLCELDVDAGYVAAMAVEGTGWSLKGWQWNPTGREVE